MSDTLSADEAMRRAAKAAAAEAENQGTYHPSSVGNSIVEAAIRALDAAGWQCVPKVATPRMLAALDAHDNVRLAREDSYAPRESHQAAARESLLRGHSLMLAAAPRLVKP